MAQCNQCKREWNSWGGGYEYCNATCFQEHLSAALTEVAVKFQTTPERTREILDALLESGTVKLNDNY